MDDVEMIFSGACDDPHHIPSVERFQHSIDAVDDAWRFSQEFAVKRVTLLSQCFDLGGRESLFFHEVPGSLSLDEEHLEVLFGRQGNADCSENVLGRLEVDMLGVDQHAVVVPEDRSNHSEAALLTSIISPEAQASRVAMNPCCSSRRAISGGTFAACPSGHD